MKRIIVGLIGILGLCFNAWAAVDLNTASQAELETVSGIGPAKAKAIVDYRSKHGSFKSAEDLEKVPGFGKKSVDKVRKDITVGNVTAAAAGKGDKSVKTADAKTAKDAKSIKETKPAKESKKAKAGKNVQDEKDAKSISVGSTTAAEAGKVDKSVKEGAAAKGVAGKEKKK